MEALKGSDEKWTDVWNEKDSGKNKAQRDEVVQKGVCTDHTTNIYVVENKIRHVGDSICKNNNSAVFT